jgi:hypothetical protein
MIQYNWKLHSIVNTFLDPKFWIILGIELALDNKTIQVKRKI